MDLVTEKKFSKAACAVLGIDYEAHPVFGVDVKMERGPMVEIHVRFAVPYGLLNSIELEMKKAGG